MKYLQSNEKANSVAYTNYACFAASVVYVKYTFFGGKTTVVRLNSLFAFS